MLKQHLKLLVIILSMVASLAVSSYVLADDPSEATALTELEGVQSVEVSDLIIFHLENGMTVCMKPTEDEDEEIIVRVAALGGFSDLTPMQRASGQLAPKSSLKSGLGEYTYDQLQALLYEHSIEFGVTIHPFCRTIDAAAYPDEVETLLKLVNLFFTQRKFEKNAFDHVIAKTKFNFKNRPKEATNSFEEMYLSYNTGGFAPLKPLAPGDLDYADFHTAEHFLNSCFNNPSDFVCLIVGQLDVKKLSPLIEEYLAPIPKQDKCFECKLKDLPTIKRNTGRKIVKNTPDATESITRLTFPIKSNITEENLSYIEAMAKVVELRLNNVVSANMQTKQVLLNASLVFPLYPSLKSPWLTVQYIVDPEQANGVESIILSQMKNLQKNGVFEAELALLKKSAIARDCICQKDNSYWVLVLSNYYLWKWDPKEIMGRRSAIGVFNAKEMTHHLRTSLSLEHYSVVTAEP